MDTILFDLDGTLLPMDQQAFMKLYFDALAKKCAGFGYEPQATINAVWAGTKAMVKNDGTITNEERFWQHFAAALGNDVLALQPALNLFYQNEFNAVQKATQPNALAAKLVRSLRAAKYTVVLATNPLFPLVAVETRLSWIGLSKEDFDHITSYESAHYTKPHLGYYREILSGIGKQAQQCLMVGNDIEEDGCTRELGMDFFLVTDTLHNYGGQDLSNTHNGSFAHLCRYIQDYFLSHSRPSS